MSGSLILAALLLAGATGAWLWPRWRAGGEPVEARVYLHGAAAALLLIALALGLDHRAAGHGSLLLACFLTVATGMLLFLIRQRQHRRAVRLLWLHGALAVLALGLAGLHVLP